MSAAQAARTEEHGILRGCALIVGTTDFIPPLFVSSDLINSLLHRNCGQQKSPLKRAFSLAVSVTLSRIVSHRFQRLVVPLGRPVAIANVSPLHRGTPRRSSRIPEPVHA